MEKIPSVPFAPWCTLCATELASDESRAGFQSNLPILMEHCSAEPSLFSNCSQSSIGTSDLRSKSTVGIDILRKGQKGWSGSAPNLQLEFSVVGYHGRDSDSCVHVRYVAYIPPEPYASWFSVLLKGNHKWHDQNVTQTLESQKRSASQHQRRATLGFGLYIGAMDCCARCFPQFLQACYWHKFQVHRQHLCHYHHFVTLAASDGLASSGNLQFLLWEHRCCSEQVNNQADFFVFHRLSFSCSR